MGKLEQGMKYIYHNVIGVLQYYKWHYGIWIQSAKYRKLPLENKIVFSNFNGKGYGCNTRSIAEEILKQKLPYDLVWLVNDSSEVLPEGIRKISFDGEDSFRELATARIVIENVKGELNFHKRRGQLFIQTWHAAYGPKYAEKDAFWKLPWGYLLETKYNSKITDLFISNSKKQSEEFRNSFWCKCEIMECGMPRNDVFFTMTEEEKNAVRQRLGIGAQQKVALFAPTFRSGVDRVEDYDMDFALLKASLEKRFGGDWMILIRLHPNIAKANDNRSEDYLIGASSYPDMQELLVVADLLVTDYSSSIVDFSEMKKPVLLYIPDLVEYEKLRGVKPMMRQNPFMIAESKEAIATALETYDEGRYLEEVESFIEEYATYDKGEASASVVERVKEYME